uniref:Putative secreted protein n=1 Tax=Ixodes ricinus TaxID=34613 RepID=A0A6B0UVK6_IXORI
MRSLMLNLLRLSIMLWLSFFWRSLASALRSLSNSGRSSSLTRARSGGQDDDTLFLPAPGQTSSNSTMEPGTVAWPPRVVRKSSFSKCEMSSKASSNSELLVAADPLCGTEAGLSGLKGWAPPNSAWALLLRNCFTCRFLLCSTW